MSFNARSLLAVSCVANWVSKETIQGQPNRAQARLFRWMTRNLFDYQFGIHLGHGIINNLTMSMSFVLLWWQGRHYCSVYFIYLLFLSASAPSSVSVGGSFTETVCPRRIHFAATMVT